MEKKTLKDLKEGSEEAFSAVYNKYYRLIKQICYSYVLNFSDAEDLMMETFIKVWHHRSKIISDKNFKYYIIQIARNLSIDYLRLREKDKTILMEISDLDTISSSTSLRGPSSPTDGIFIKIKDILDKESYEILVLHYIHRLKYREIALIKEVTVSVITNKASRAIKLIKERLKNEN